MVRTTAAHLHDAAAKPVCCCGTLRAFATWAHMIRFAGARSLGSHLAWKESRWVRVARTSEMHDVGARGPSRARPSAELAFIANSCETFEVASVIHGGYVTVGAKVPYAGAG